MGAVLCGLLQWWIDGAADNLLATLLIVLSTVVLYEYLIRSRAILDQPISTLMLLGFNTTTTLVALFAQTLSGLAVTHLLRAPVLTFSLMSGLLLLAIGVHWCYRHLAATVALREWLARRVFQPLGALEAPMSGPSGPWLRFGAVSTLRGNAEFGDVNGKLFQAMGFLQWLPFVIPLYHQRWGKAYCDMRVHFPCWLPSCWSWQASAWRAMPRQLMLIGPFRRVDLLALGGPPGIAHHRTHCGQPGAGCSFWSASPCLQTCRPP